MKWELVEIRFFLIVYEPMIVKKDAKFSPRYSRRGWCSVAPAEDFFLLSNVAAN